MARILQGVMKLMCQRRGNDNDGRYFQGAERDGGKKRQEHCFGLYCVQVFVSIRFVVLYDDSHVHVRNGILHAINGMTGGWASVIVVSSHLVHATPAPNLFQNVEIFQRDEVSSKSLSEIPRLAGVYTRSITNVCPSLANDSWARWILRERAQTKPPLQSVCAPAVGNRKDTKEVDPRYEIVSCGGKLGEARRRGTSFSIR